MFVAFIEKHIDVLMVTHLQPPLVVFQSSNRKISIPPTLSKTIGTLSACLYPDKVVSPCMSVGDVMLTQTPLSAIFVDKPPAIILPSSPLNESSISLSSDDPNICFPIVPNVCKFPQKTNFPFISPVKTIKTPNVNRKSRSCK